MSLKAHIKDWLGANDFWASIVIIALAIAISLLVHFVVYWWMHRYSQREEHPNVAIIRRKTKVSSLILLIVAVLMIFLPALKLDMNLEENLKHFLSILLVINLGWLLIVGVDVFENIVVARFGMEAEDTAKAKKITTQMKVFERILIALIAVITISAVLMTFENIRQLGASLLASAGIAGLIIGLSAQRILGSILAGIQIAITQPIRLEDTVIVEGEFGNIEEITLTYVVVRSWDARRIIVPINYFNENVFQNWTRNKANVLGQVFLYTDYKVPIEALKTELMRLLKQNESWDKEVANLQVVDTFETHVKIRILVRTISPKQTWDMRVYLREGLIEFLQKNYPDSLVRTRVQMLEEKTTETKE